MHKKILAISLAGFLAFFAVAALSVSHHAFADQNENGSSMTSQSENGAMNQDTQESENEGMHATGDVNQSVTINPNGDFRLTGATVNTVDASSNSVNAALYGFNKTVNLSGAEITGGGKTISVSDIQAGDKLSASGNFNLMTHAITISTVNDVSYTSRNTLNIQAKINHLLDLVHQLQAQLEALGGH